MDPYNSADVLVPSRNRPAPAQASPAVQPGVPLPAAWLNPQEDSAPATRRSAPVSTGAAGDARGWLPSTLRRLLGRE